MQIVINISDELYDETQKGNYNYNIFERQVFIDTMIYNIINSTPLPKGHGRLIDVSDLIPDSDYEDGLFCAVSIGQINGAPTIIEADVQNKEQDFQI